MYQRGTNRAQTALLRDPDVPILDEPLSGIDMTSALLFKHLLNVLARDIVEAIG